MYFQYWQDNEHGYWHWHLRAANHEIIAWGESYVREADCLHCINLIKGANDAPVRRAYVKS
jgi:uncharacterized protein